MKSPVLMLIFGENLAFYDLSLKKFHDRTDATSYAHIKLGVWEAYLNFELNQLLPKFLDYVNIMRQYISVDVYGNCGNFTCAHNFDCFEKLGEVGCFYY